MTEQLDLLDLIDDDVAGVTHVVLPDFLLGCGIAFLDKHKKDAVRFSSHDWQLVTCPWCHSLGADWYRHECARYQGRAA